MTDWNSLDPETRCYALVGRFLFSLTQLEICINAALQSAMRVPDLMRFILCANITLRDKISILRSLVSVSNLSDAEREHFSSVLEDALSKCLPKRNMIAHDSFRPDKEGKGVEFLRVQAKSEFNLPSFVWSISDFEREGAIVDNYAVEVAKLKDRFANVEFDYSRVTRLITVLAPAGHEIPALEVPDRISPLMPVYRPTTLTQSSS